MRVGGSCTREGGAEAVEYGVSSLLKSFRVGAETMVVKRLRRGAREDRMVWRETMFYIGRTWDGRRDEDMRCPR